MGDYDRRNKEIIARAVEGKVKWFNVKYGYGFVTRMDTKEDVFIHQSAIVRPNPVQFQRSVGDGEMLEFDVVDGDKGQEAVNVTGPGGRNVKGSTYASDRRDRDDDFGGGRRGRGGGGGGGPRFGGRMDYDNGYGRGGGGGGYGGYRGGGRGGGGYRDYGGGDDFRMSRNARPYDGGSRRVYAGEGGYDNGYGGGGGGGYRSGFRDRSRSSGGRGGGGGFGRSRYYD